MTAERMYVRVADWKDAPGSVPGDDVDSYLRREGPDGFRHMIDNARPYGDWLIDAVEEELEDETDIYVIAQAVKRLLSVMAKEPDPVIRAHYMRRVATLAKTEEVLAVELEAMAGPPAKVLPFVRATGVRRPFAR